MQAVILRFMTKNSYVESSIAHNLGLSHSHYTETTKLILLCRTQKCADVCSHRHFLLLSTFDEKEEILTRVNETCYRVGTT